MIVHVDLFSLTLNVPQRDGQTNRQTFMGIPITALSGGDAW